MRRVMQQRLKFFLPSRKRRIASGVSKSVRCAIRTRSLQRMGVVRWRERVPSVVSDFFVLSRAERNVILRDQTGMNVRKAAHREQGKDVVAAQKRRKNQDRARNVKKWSVIS